MKGLHNHQNFGNGGENVEFEKGGEEEIYEELDEDLEDEEFEEDPEEEVCEEVGEDSEEEIYEEVEEDPEEELNEGPDDVKQPVGNSNPSSSVTGGKDPEEERGKKVVEGFRGEPLSNLVAPTGGNSRKHRKSRWDFNEESETPQIGANKRRKTRWDNIGSQNASVELPTIFNSSDLVMDPKTISLKMQLIEINKKLLSSEIHDERPAEERSPSPEPEYNNLGIRINTRDARLRKKLLNEQKRIISKLAKANLISKPPAKPNSTEGKPAMYVKKLFIPKKEYPTYNFIGLILGPRGNTQKKMEKETGAKIRLRGKGSGQPDESGHEELHVRVEADSQQALDAAVSMVEKLLIPVEDKRNAHKRAQLTELAKLRGNYKDNNICNLCKETGHRQYACPLQDSTFNAVCCDICGSFGHSTSDCRASISSGVLLGFTDGSNKEIDCCNIYVGYLSHAIDEKRLKELFSPFGKILKTAVIKDQTTGLSKGYGFVKFENPSDATDAVTYMNGYRMDGKMLAVRVAGQKPIMDSSDSGQVSIHSRNTALPPNIPHQAAYMTGLAPSLSILPEAQASISNYKAFSFPSSSSYFQYKEDISQAKSVNDPMYFTSSNPEPRMMSNYSQGYEFVSKIPRTLSNSVSRFPGDPDHPGSQFKSYFNMPTMQDADRERFK